jgi:hypothetical protein
MSPNTRRQSSSFAVDHVAYKTATRYAEWQMCPATADFKVFVTRLAIRWLHTVEAEKPAQTCGRPERVEPMAEAATSLTEQPVLSAKVRTQKGGTSIRGEPENQAEEASSDLAFATTMFRALEHIVLWSTECSVRYYSIVAVDKALSLVEAQNFAPYIWAPGAEGASGATGYARDHCDPWRPVFCSGRARREGR